MENHRKCKNGLEYKLYHNIGSHKFRPTVKSIWIYDGSEVNSEVLSKEEHQK